MELWQRGQGTLRTTTVAIAIAIVGCGGDNTTTFPPGLMPLTVSNLAPPAPTPTEMYPEAFTANRGMNGSVIWVHGMAYVHAPLTAVISALLTPAVVVDRRKVQMWTVDLNDEPMYEHSYLIHNTAHDILTVQFDLAWRLAVVTGTDTAPQVFVAVYQKTYGTSFITLLAGSVVATAINPGVTQLDMVRQLDAQGSGADDLQQYLMDLTASITATVHGMSLPNYN